MTLSSFEELQLSQASCAPLATLPCPSFDSVATLVIAANIGIQIYFGSPFAIHAP